MTSSVLALCTPVHRRGLTWTCAFSLWLVRRLNVLSLCCFLCALSHHTLRTLSFSNHGSRSLGKPNLFSGDPPCNLLLTELNWLPLQLKYCQGKPNC